MVSVAIGLDRLIGLALHVLILMEISTLEVDGSCHQRLPQTLQYEIYPLVVVDGIQGAVFQLFLSFPTQRHMLRWEEDMH